MLKLKKRKYQNYRSAFAKRYRQCNRCEKELDITRNEEIVCVLCGETYCNCCINNHQKYCYSSTIWD